MAKVWELRNGRCYCSGYLAPDRGCDGPNCRTCCYNMNKYGKTSNKLTLAEYESFPKEDKAFLEKPLEKHIKVISLLTVENTSKFLNSNGDNRKITITGDVGAVFTLTIKDSSDCNILKEKIENFKMTNSTFSFNQKFPAIKTGLTSETYTIRIAPTADTILKRHYPTSRIMVYYNNADSTKIYQYPDPTVTITKVSTQTGPALALAGDDITKTGGAGTYTNGLPGYTSSTYTLAVTESGGEASGYFYVKGNPKFEDNITSSTLIKKVIKRDDIKDRSAINILDCLQPAPAVSDGATVSTSYTGEVKKGFKWKGEVSYTKTVFSSLETTDGIKINSCNDATDKFKLENTDKLFEGMTVTGISNGKYINDQVVKTWDNEVTLSSKHVIRNGTTLTFKYKEDGEITRGETIPQKSLTTLPHNTTIEIEGNETTIKGNMQISGSGSNTLTVTTAIDVLKFGKEDVTYTLDLDNFIVRKPNIYDQEVIVKKDTATKINMILYDRDANAKSKLLTSQSTPSNGSISHDADLDVTTYTPNPGFTGEDSFTFLVTDGTTASDLKTIFITVK